MKLLYCFSILKNNSTLYLYNCVKIFAFILLLPLYSCKDELINAGPSVKTPSSSLILMELPGVMGIELTSTNHVQTRAENQTSDGRPFDDGLEEEYALADPLSEDEEFYHYLILYKTNNASAAPIIFPLDVTNAVIDPNSTNNITLTVNSMLATTDRDSNEPLTVSDLRNLIKDTKPYILLNFKLDNSTDLGNLNGIDFSNATSTPQKLLMLTRAQFESLKLTDYKVSGNKTDTEQSSFFIMSSSVYSDNSKKVIDGSIDPDKIFGNEQAAAQNPALSAHVERLASKVTVSFNTTIIGAADFDPYGQQQIERGSVKINNETGLPEFRLKVQKVDMSYTGGIKFDESGYTIMTNDVGATIRILGYGLGNLERQEYLFKDINYALSAGSWAWNDEEHHRSYWARDSHYGLTKPVTNPFLKSKAEGYPHQFRLALDSDTVASYHTGLDNGYNDYTEFQESYRIDGVTYYTYNKLGDIKTDATIQNSYLKYKSFKELYDEFQNHRVALDPAEISPFYSLENTYYDQGSLTSGAWIWPWQRAPYAAATNLIVLAEIEIDKSAYDTSSPSQDSGSDNFTQAMATSDGYSEDTDNVPTVYLGQNNIFYLKKVNLLNSKLTILNNVMLQGGNAGIQILNGQWDCHKPGDNSNTLLDKVAWNEGSVLWFAKVRLNEDGYPDYERTPMKGEDGEILKDKDGNTIYSYKILTEEPWQVSIDTGKSDSDPQALDLIPAEISGGDGQMLIAPSQEYMGKAYRYYLAPAKLDENGREIMDEDLAVEISYNHLVALIHKIIGPVDVYTHGKMYFSVPIPHRISTFTSSNFNTAWKTFGAFSMVRNNWYNIEITEFTHLGTPVHRPTQPIVPVMDVKRSYINMGVKLKDWHNVTQDNIPMM